MTEATPYLWLSESHRNLVKARYDQAVQAWNARWLRSDISIFSPSVDLDRYVATTPADAEEVWSLENGDRSFAFVEFAGTGSFQSFFDRVIAVAAKLGRARQTSAVAVEVAQMLLADWVEAFLGPRSTAERTPVWRKVDAIEVSEMVGKQALKMRFEADGLSLALLVPAATVRCLLPPVAAQSKRAFTSLIKASDSAAVKLTVRLEASEGLALEAVENLSLGDIVLLDREPGDHWTLAGPDGVAVASCTPGRAGSYFAVQILDPK